jgi:hypothetical protein
MRFVEQHLDGETIIDVGSGEGKYLKKEKNSRRRTNTKHSTGGKTNNCNHPNKTIHYSSGSGGIVWYLKKNYAQAY